MMKSVSLVCLLAACSYAAESDSVNFARPLLGFVSEEGSTKHVRPITGTPGAALVTSALPGVEADAIAVSSRQRLAIAAAPGADALQVMRSLGAEHSMTPIPDSVRSFDLAAFAPSERTAAVYSKDCDCVQVLTDLLNEPKIARTILLPQDGLLVDVIAVSEDGSTIALARHSETTDQLSVYRAGEEQPGITVPARVTALTFAADGNDLAFADVGSRNISLLRDVNGNPETTLITGTDDRLKHPVGILFRPDRRIVVADAESGLLVVDRDTQNAEWFWCRCRPSALGATASEDVFRLTGIDKGSVWIVRLGEAAPQTMFVPAPRSEDAQ